MKGLPSTQFDLAEPLALAATGMVTRTLDACAQVMGVETPQAVIEGLVNGDTTAWRHCRDGLAEQVAVFLGALDTGIKAIYLYDPEAFGAALHTSEEATPLPIHLIVWSQRKTAALRALVAALDRALVHQVVERLGLYEVARLLDVQVITDTDVANRVGFAPLLFRLQHEAHQLWKR